MRLSRRQTLPAALLPGLLLVAPAGAASAEPARVERRLAAMGTELSVVVEAADRPTALQASEAAVRAIETVEARLSSWRSDSALSVLARSPVGAWAEIDAALAGDLALARWCHGQTDGAFDPTVGALVEAWGLRTGGRTPGPEEIALALSRVGLGRLEVDGLRARRQVDLGLDAGAFGKGIGLDAGLAAARSAGATVVTLDLGGQVAHHGSPLVLDVAHPADRTRVVAALGLDGGSSATSGQGERPGHILDPRTGQPVPAWGSVTVKAPRAAEADCLSTGLYVLGPDAALGWASAHPGYEVLVVEATAGQPSVRRSHPLRTASSAPGVDPPGVSP